MIELVRINNKWVKESDLPTGDKAPDHLTFLNLKAKGATYADSYKSLLHIEEVKPCKTHDDIVKGFEGDEEIEANELSTRHREYILQKERMGSLRYVLGWNLYQEWVKETITGHE